MQGDRSRAVDSRWPVDAGQVSLAGRGPIQPPWRQQVPRHWLRVAITTRGSEIQWQKLRTPGPAQKEKRAAISSTWPPRSEERRVGKAVKSRGTPLHADLR